MILRNLNQKIKIIGSLSESDPIFDVADALRSHTATFPDIPRGVMDAATQALFYAVIRHRPFVQAPLFGAVLASYLSSHFGLPASLSRGLVEELVRHTRRAWSSRPFLVPPTDREFLRYLVAHVTSSQDLGTLMRDWGLGAEILVKLSKSMQFFDFSHEGMSSSTPVFLPELDAHISQIVYDLAMDQEQNPWAVKQWLLRFSLMEVPEPWCERLKDQGESWLLQALVRIGLKCQASLQSIKEGLKPNLGPDIPLDEYSWLLKTFDLAYPIAQSTQQSLWELSAFGRTLTREIVASHLLSEKGPSPLGEYIGTLYPEYQVALLRQYPFASSEELATLALHCRPLSPLALEVALERLADLASPEKSQVVAQEIVQRDSSTWLRKTASKRLNDGPRAEKLTDA